MNARLTPRNEIVIFHAGTPLALRPLATPSPDIVARVNERLRGAGVNGQDAGAWMVRRRLAEAALREVLDV